MCLLRNCVLICLKTCIISITSQRRWLRSFGKRDAALTQQEDEAKEVCYKENVRTPRATTRQKALGAADKEQATRDSDHVSDSDETVGSD